MRSSPLLCHEREIVDLHGCPTDNLIFPLDAEDTASDSGRPAAHLQPRSPKRPEELRQSSTLANAETQITDLPVDRSSGSITYTSDPAAIEIENSERLQDIIELS